MKFLFCYYCPDCEEIFEYKRLSGVELLACPSCTNRLIVPLHRIMFQRNLPEAKNGATEM